MKYLWRRVVLLLFCRATQPDTIVIGFRPLTRTQSVASTTGPAANGGRGRLPSSPVGTVQIWQIFVDWRWRWTGTAVWHQSIGDSGSVHSNRPKCSDRVTSPATATRASSTRILIDKHYVWWCGLRGRRRSPHAKISIPRPSDGRFCIQRRWRTVSLNIVYSFIKCFYRKILCILFYRNPKLCHSLLNVYYGSKQETYCFKSDKSQQKCQPL